MQDAEWLPRALVDRHRRHHSPATQLHDLDP
jgi:hypothetical protein